MSGHLGGKRILFPPQTIAGESLPGLLARAAADNFLEQPNWLLKSAQIPSPHAHDLSRRIGRRTAMLAEVLGVETSTLAELQFGECVDNRLRNFFGSEIRNTHLVHEYRRISPAALKRSAHHRALWMVRPISFCTETWEMLIDTCPGCKRKLGWKRARGIDICEHCEMDLREASSPTVPPPDRDVLDFVCSLISPSSAARQAALERVPSCFSHLLPAELFELALILGRVSLRANPELRTLQPYSAMLMGGEALMADKREEFAGPPTLENLRSPKAHILLGREVACVGRPRLREAMETMLGGLDGPKPGPSRLRNARLRRGALTLSEAAAELGLERSRLRMLINEGQIRGEERSGAKRKHTWLTPREVEVARNRLSERMSAHELSKQLGLPAGVIASLVADGLVCESTDSLVRLAYTGLQLQRASAESLVERIQAHVGDLPPRIRWQSLNSAMARVGGAPKPWGQVLRLALEGQLVDGLRRAPMVEPALPRLKVSPTDIGLLVRRGVLPGEGERRAANPLQAALVSKVEAQSILNCYPRDLGPPIEAGVLKGQGKDNGSLSREAVLAFGRTHISSMEMKARFGANYAALRKTLKDRSIERAIGVFWRRDEIETAICRLEHQEPDRSPPTASIKFDKERVTFGAAIAAARHKKGLGQVRLGLESGLNQGYISAIERGMGNPSLEIMSRLAHALDVQLADLFVSTALDSGR